MATFLRFGSDKHRFGGLTLMGLGTTGNRFVLSFLRDPDGNQWTLDRSHLTLRSRNAGHILIWRAEVSSLLTCMSHYVPDLRF